MNKMTGITDHNITVVSIFDLKNITDNAICGKTVDEVHLCSFVFFGTFITVSFYKVRMQVNFKCFTQLISWSWVWNYLDNAAEYLFSARSITYTFVRMHVQIHSVLLKYLLEQLDELKCKYILSEVIISFEYTRYYLCALFINLHFLVCCLIHSFARFNSLIISINSACESHEVLDQWFRISKVSNC